jgi:hypothetical protein
MGLTDYSPILLLTSHHRTLEEYLRLLMAQRTARTDPLVAMPDRCGWDHPDGMAERRVLWISPREGRWGLWVGRDSGDHASLERR